MHKIEEKIYGSESDMHASFIVRRVVDHWSDDKAVHIVQIEPCDAHDGTAMDFVCVDEESAKTLFMSITSCSAVAMLTTR